MMVIADIEHTARKGAGLRLARSSRQQQLSG